MVPPSLGRFGAQPDDEARALAGCAFDADAAAVAFDQAVAHREPQAGAVLALGAEEGIENTVQMPGRNAGPELAADRATPTGIPFLDIHVDEAGYGRAGPNLLLVPGDA